MPGEDLTPDKEPLCIVNGSVCFVKITWLTQMMCLFLKRIIIPFLKISTLLLYHQNVLLPNIVKLELRISIEDYMNSFRGNIFNSP